MQFSTLASLAVVAMAAFVQANPVSPKDMGSPLVKEACAIVPERDLLRLLGMLLNTRQLSTAIMDKMNDPWISLGIVVNLLHKHGS
ncbi:hypothetical protein LQW54_003592 [Pestalotiopsis sp. IQ-011]